VFAVPGEITSALSEGTNALLRLGATPVTRVEDVLEVFGLDAVPASAVALGPIAERLLARLQDGALTADEVVRASGVDPGTGAAALVELELAGRVTLEDGVYRTAV
jgi:DNA processing protein